MGIGLCKQYTYVMFIEQYMIRNIQNLARIDRFLILFFAKDIAAERSDNSSANRSAI